MSLSAVLTPIVVPPVNLVVLALLAVWWRKRTLAIVALGGLVLLAMPLVAGGLIGSLEAGMPAVPDTAGVQAVLILGGDVNRVGPDRAIPGPLTLERLRAGVALARATGLPLAVTGGVAWAGGPSIGQVMADSLAQDFGQTARWVETQSDDTWENARDSAALLVPDGIHDVLVVTHAWHMRRSLLAFQDSGLQARAAPLWVDWRRTGSPVPSAGAWQQSYYALHEWIGIAWYTVRTLIGQ